MMTQSKRINGKLFDRSGSVILAEVLVDVILRDPQNQVDKPSYSVVLTVDGYKPELDNQSHILKLDDKISGEVFVTIAGLPGEKTQYSCSLSDGRWNGLEWFRDL